MPKTGPDGDPEGVMDLKRFALFFVIALCLLPLCGRAADDALYPIRENGLWGYMDRAGETVIDPRWISAEPFSGGVAIVEEDNDHKDGKGLIRTNGDYILLPEYRVEEAREVYIYSQWDESLQQYGKEGFYDKASGFLLSPSFDYIYDYGWDVLLVHDGFPEDCDEEEEEWDEDWADEAEWDEFQWNGSEDEAANPYYSFIRRDTGEFVFPKQYSALYDDVGYYSGYVLVSDERDLWEDDEWVGIEAEYHLFDPAGQEVVFPEGIAPDSGIFEGVLRISRQLTDEEAEQNESGWGTVYGLGRPDGTVIVEPQYDFLTYAGDGLVSIYQDHLHGLMDPEGRVIVSPTYFMDWGGPLPQIIYENGYAVIEDAGEDWWIILTTDGHEVFQRPVESEDGIAFRLCGDVLDSGLIWYEDSQGFGLMHVTEQGAEYLTGGVYEAARSFDFSEGLHPVKQNGLWGYINKQAEWVIPPQYDSADNFRDGLALVEKDGKLMYIDHSGTVVWKVN